MAAASSGAEKKVVVARVHDQPVSRLITCQDVVNAFRSTVVRPLVCALRFFKSDEPTGLPTELLLASVDITILSSMHLLAAFSWRAPGEDSCRIFETVKARVLDVVQPEEQWNCPPNLQFEHMWNGHPVTPLEFLTTRLTELGVTVVNRLESDGESKARSCALVDAPISLADLFDNRIQLKAPSLDPLLGTSAWTRAPFDCTYEKLSPLVWKTRLILNEAHAMFAEVCSARVITTTGDMAGTMLVQTAVTDDEIIQTAAVRRTLRVASSWALLAQKRPDADEATLDADGLHEFDAYMQQEIFSEALVVKNKPNNTCIRVEKPLNMQVLWNIRLTGPNSPCLYTVDLCWDREEPKHLLLQELNEAIKKYMVKNFSPMKGDSFVF